MDLLKSNINADFKPDQTTSDLLETKHRFDDDFGPETDVDAVDDANVAKTPNMLLEDHAFSAADLSNGVKPFSLENKIIEHLSGQHKEFLTNTNPFSDEQFDEYNNQQQAVKDELMDEITVEKCEIDSELVVDNKIIDALESLGITNGEKQTHDDEDKPLESGLVNDSSAEVAGYTEKVDNSHEKYYTEMQNEDPFDNNGANVCDKQTIEDQAYVVNPNCAATSAGEESDEEEDEWNYIQGDKKQDAQPAEQSESEPASSVEVPAVEAEVEAASDHHQAEDLVSTFGSEPAAEEDTEKQQQQQPLDEPLAELADPAPSDTDAFAAVVAEPSETAIEEEDDESRAVEAAAEPCGDEGALIDLIPAAVASPVVPTEEEYKLQEQEDQQEQVVQETEQLESAEYVPSPVPRSELQQSEEIQEEPISQPNDLVSLEQEPTLDKEATEELPKEEALQEESAQSEESPIAVAADDDEVERPDSLSFDMASKLNPEAKEFVPTGSPTQSNPTSPVASMPEMPQNAFLVLGDDVVAQSPKKGIATMDNIDVPAEDDFQQEMNNCPHELEQFPEHTNGTTNGDEIIGSHSPISEPSYQELNLKEAMQGDEKLDNEYSDVQQNDDTIDNHLPVELNLLAKEQNPMSMSFYEGRDEALIISNSDELNKVQPLPSDDESSELINGQSVEETMAANEEETLPVEEAAPVQHEVNLVSFENTIESVNEEKHVEQLPESIFSAASQVVDDVAALVGRMEIEIPTAPQQEETETPFELDEQFSKPPVETEHLSNAIETENLVSFEQDTEFENHVKEEAAVQEIAMTLDVEQPVLQHEVAELSQPLSAAETDEMASPVVEVSQQEITTDNEFITDENVLDVVPSPVPTGHEAPISPVPVALQNDETVEEELCVVEKEAPVEQMPEVTPIDAPTELPAVAEPAPIIVNEEPIIEEVKPVVDETAEQKTTTTSEEVTVPKPKTPEPVVSSVAKTTKAPATGGAAKKASAAAKPATTKPAAKPTTAAKTTTAPPAAKKPAPTAAARTSTVGAATKSPKVTATTRTSTAGTADKKPTATADKKLVNGDAKPAPIQKRNVTSTSASATAKTTTTTAARPSSAGAKSVTAAAAKPAAAATRPAAPAKAPASAKAPTTARAPVSAAPRPTTGPAKTGPASTARTSTGLPATKPRVATTTASKPAGATTASKTTASATKRISSVQTTTQKTATTSTTTTAAAATKSSSTTSRTSVVSKTSSTTSSAGLVRKTGPAGAAPARKPLTSPSAAKASSKNTAPVPIGRPAPIRKATAVKEVKEAALSNNDTNQDLLDLDKQLKNDNNQLITKNGIETQMIVIDSAAD
uniref:Putative microtubule-associated protein n=1 Tax=Culex tarsalis TaxID=7177 RepID=A0A1Q3FAG4_CULTA